MAFKPIGLMDVLRRPQDTPAVARDAVAVGARALWLQLGIAIAIAGPEARSMAEAAGLRYVEERCAR